MRPKQQTLAASGFERYRKRTRREQFLADMNRVVPWGRLVELIAPTFVMSDLAMNVDRVMHPDRSELP
jgi:hypothetical protein